MARWAAFCAGRSRDDVVRATRSVDARAEVSFARSADGLRALVMGSVPGELGVVVGPEAGGVADVNLAAAVANDGNARCVVLVREGVSGSLRSRAARAGIDQVIELSDLPAEPEAPPVRCGREGDAGRALPAPAPAVARPLPGSREGRAPVLVLCSGRGGVGKTSIAATAAVQAASWGMRVSVLDLDLSCGNLFGCFGLPRGSDLARLGDRGAPDAEALNALCVAAAPGVRLAGPCELPETAELAAPHASELIEVLAAASDVLLVDTSATFTDAVAQAAQAADRLLLVSDGRPGSLSALARSSGLAVRLGVARTRIARVENRASPRARASLTAGRGEVGLEAARVYRVLEGGAEVAELLAAGQATELVGSGIAFAESVATVLAQLLAELGRLPSCNEAERAAQGPATRRWPAIFGHAREAS